MHSANVACVPSLPYQQKIPKLFKKISYIYEKHSAEDLERLARIGKFPVRPSNLFLKMYSDVLYSVHNHPGTNIVDEELMATSGVIPLTINAPFDTLFLHHRDCILSAEKEILIAAGFWRNGKVVQIITSALRDLNARLASTGGSKVLVKILWGRGKLQYHKKNNEKQKVKLSLPTAAECPFLDIETMDVHKPPIGVFHVKYTIIDRKIVLLTSANMQDKKNFEFMTRMEGKVVDSFYGMFKTQWSLSFTPPLPLADTPAPTRSGIEITRTPVHGPCIYHSDHNDVPMFFANKLPGSALGHRKWEVPQNVAWLSAMYHAQRNIWIQTPDFNATLPFVGVIEACKRGVNVTIVLSWVYNALKEKIFLQGGTNIHVMKKLYRKLEKINKQEYLTVCFYVEKSQPHPTKQHANHTKFMAVDDEVAVMGSGNMDTQSWHHSQETNIVVASPLLVKEWMDLFRANQNSEVFGVVNPHLSVSPVEQIRQLLSRNNTQPVNNPPPVPAIINNSTHPLPATTNAYSTSMNNNFSNYYNSFRGMSSTEAEASNQSITNSGFFRDPSASIPSPQIVNNIATVQTNPTMPSPALQSTSATNNMVSNAPTAISNTPNAMSAPSTMSNGPNAIPYTAMAPGDSDSDSDSENEQEDLEPNMRKENPGSTVPRSSSMPLSAGKPVF